MAVPSDPSGFNPGPASFATWVDDVTDTAFDHESRIDTLEAAPGGGGSIAVEDEGTEVVANATRFDFTGPGVTVTDGGSGQANIAIPGYTAKGIVKKRRTAGNLTLNSTNWANVDTALDIVLTGVTAGDEIAYGASGLLQNENVQVFFDVATIVSSAPLNSLARRAAVETAPGTSGFAMWNSVGAQYWRLAGVTPPYTLVSGDIVAGTVTLRLRYATGVASNKTLFASASNLLDVWAMNLGPAQA